jgi:hypothetical protein
MGLLIVPWKERIQGLQREFSDFIFYITAHTLHIPDLQCPIFSINYREVPKGNLELEFHIFCNAFVILHTSLLLIFHYRNADFAKLLTLQQRNCAVKNYLCISSNVSHYIKRTFLFL